MSALNLQQVYFNDGRLLNYFTKHCTERQFQFMQHILIFVESRFYCTVPVKHVKIVTDYVFLLLHHFKPDPSSFQVSFPRSSDALCNFWFIFYYLFTNSLITTHLICSFHFSAPSCIPQFI